MKQRYMVMDVAICHDCNNCFMACKDEHVGNDWAGYTDAQPRHGHRWLNLLRTERGPYPRVDCAFLALTCQHCENAPCIEKSNGAITRRDDGIVMIDAEKAKGNKELLDSCPYGAIYWNEEKSVPQKCTMCAHLLDDGWNEPRCSHSCPTYSLKTYYCEPAEMEKMVQDEGLAIYKPELGTKPHVYYKNLYRFTKNYVAGAILLDGDCVEGASVTISGPGGKSETQTTNFFGDFKFDDLEDGSYSFEIEGKGKKTSATAEVKGESLDIGPISL